MPRQFVAKAFQEQIIDVFERETKNQVDGVRFEVVGYSFSRKWKKEPKLDYVVVKASIIANGKSIFEFEEFRIAPHETLDVTGLNVPLEIKFM